MIDVVFFGGGTTEGHNALIEISFAIEKGERTIIPTFIKKIDPLRWLEDEVTLELFREANVKFLLPTDSSQRF